MTGALNLEAEDPVGLYLAYGMSSDPGTTFGYSNGTAHLVATLVRSMCSGRPSCGVVAEQVARDGLWLYAAC